MTWTYTSTDLSTDLMKIRRIIGDVDSSDQLLQNEEINAASSQTSTLYDAAALAAEWIAAGFARKADKTVGPFSITLNQKFAQYMALAARLRIDSGLATLPFAGGISISRKDTVNADTDRVEPAFSVDMLDRPGLSTAGSSRE